MPSDAPIPDPAPYMVAFLARAERRRKMLRELDELDAKVAEALARAQSVREASRNFDRLASEAGYDLSTPGSGRPTYH